MRMSKRLKEIYAKAAAAIQRKGHARGKFVTDTGQMCIWGAISLVVDGDPCRASVETQDMLKPLERLLGGHDVVAWNNEPNRKKKEVVALLRRAAAP